MSERVLNPDKSVPIVLSRSFKAASSILKSLTSLDPRKSQSTNPASGVQSTQSIPKSVSIVASEKIAAINLPKIESQLSAQETDDERERTITIADLKSGKILLSRKRTTKFMRKYPELFRDDVSIHPSYTGLTKFPYNVVCRQRFHKNKLKINQQLNREIESMTMMQTLALDGVRVGRIFTVGFHPSETIVPDFATPSERLRINRLLCKR